MIRNLPRKVTAVDKQGNAMTCRDCLFFYEDEDYNTGCDLSGKDIVVYSSFVCKHFTGKDKE